MWFGERCNGGNAEKGSVCVCDESGEVSLSLEGVRRLFARRWQQLSV